MEKSKKILDSDAIYCTEIENRNDAQTLHEILTGESIPGKSASQQLTLVGGKRYNLRSSLSQGETQMRQREQTLATMKLRLRQIQARLEKADISSDESQAMVEELREMSQKVDNRSTKATIENVISQLQSVRKPLKMSVIPEMAPKKKRGRPMQAHHWCKPLNFKPKSTKTAKKRDLPKNATTSVDDSQAIVTLDQTSLSETYKDCKKLLDKSKNLFNQEIVAPNQINLGETVDRLQKIMDQSKALIEAQKSEREKAEKRKSITQPPQFSKKPRIDFDPYTALYSEKLFSGTIIPATQESKENTENSWFNDSIIALGQKIPSDMEYDRLMKTSFTKNSFNLQSDISASDLFVLKDVSAEKDKSNSNRFAIGAQQSFDMNSSLMSSKVDGGKDGVERVQGNLSEGLLQNRLFMLQKAKHNTIEQQGTKNQEISIGECSNGANMKRTDSNNDPFHPIHIHLLAKRLHTNEVFLKDVINETFHQKRVIERQFAHLDSMEVDRNESHVSNTPMKPSVRCTSRKNSDEIFNIPMFEKF